MLDKGAEIHNTTKWLIKELRIKLVFLKGIRRVYLDLGITVMNVMASEVLGYHLSSRWKRPVYWF